MSETQTTVKALHWLVVGYVSDGAKAWIEETGGQVRPLSEDPKLTAVALAYNPQGSWVWSKGRQEHRQGIEYWSTGELQEASTGITLQYGNSANSHALAEYCSAETNYLILPDEIYDSTTCQAVKYEPASSDDSLGDLDEQLF